MIKMGFTGDILSYPNQNKKLKQKFGDYDYSTVLQEVKPLFTDCDYVCGSLETPISSEHDYSKNEIVFNTPSSFLSALKEVGVDLLTTANNHCLDRGLSGLNNTIDAINKEGLDFTGTRKSPVEKNYLVKTIKGKRIAFVAFTYDTNADVNNCYLDATNDYVVNLTKKQWAPTSNNHSPKALVKAVVKGLYKLLRPNTVQLSQKAVLDCASQADFDNPINARYLDNIKETIAKAKAESDFLVFLPHTGGQFNSEIGEYTNSLIKLISDCGADAIVCNHTHCVLPIKKENNQVIAYALGNFSFTPGEGYYVDGVFADYSTILYLTISDSNVLEASFSIVKNTIDKDGISIVHPVYDLYNKMTSSNEKEGLYKDVIEVLKRVGYPGGQRLQKEYVI